MSAMLKYSYFRNKILPSDEACISIASHSLQYGTMCFGGMRGYLRNGSARVLRIADHHERLMNGVKILGIDFHMAFDAFQEIMISLIRANAPEGDFYIRPFVFSDDQVIGPCMDGRQFQLAIYLLPLTQYFKRNGGLRLMVSSRKKFSDGSMPTKAKASGCYLNSALATAEARRNGYDEAIFMDDNANIIEASVANLFMVYRGKVLTPHIGCGPLEGITMRTVMTLLQDDGIPAHFDMIDRSMLYTCDEIFLTGSAAEVTYVESVDGRPVGNRPDLTQMGPICKRAHELFCDLIDLKHPRSEMWVSQYAC